MSVTTTILMQDDKRGESPRKTIRLPAIAPKDDYSSSASSSRSGRVTGPAVPPRARLPPRSRTGCWTCRHRKVKCDEGHPVCGQCSRLGHTCDYSPRLSFRDDTPRVVERMADITIAGPVWDRQFASTFGRRHSTDATAIVASPTTSSAGSNVADDLPPFASLTTDEERERKAEASSPGTYQVVVNPGSFQHLPEYNDGVEIKRERLSPLRRTSIAASLASSIGRDTMMEAVPVPGDPNTVVLPRFEDLSRKTTRELKSPTSPVVQLTQIKLEEAELPRLVMAEDDVKSLAYFRKVIWKQLAPAESENMSSVVLLDRIAAGFPPLSYAMKAVAFQAMAQRDGKESMEALRHYTQALPELQSHLRNLKSEEDLASDGVFLTHFLMLVYEIATADLEHSQIRTHLMRMLYRIALRRRNTFQSEPFPFIIWWICNIDLDSIFSGIDGGDFVSSMFEDDSIPAPAFHLYPLGVDGMSVIHTDERDTLPTILQLDFEVTRLASRLAMLAREFRNEPNFRNMDPRQRDMTVRHWQGRIFEYQEALRQLWMSPPVLALLQHTLPTRAQRVYEHAFTLYRACIIYSHTSMWPAQRMDTSPDYIDELAFAASEIVQVASNLLSNGRTECRFLVFPLFMAGFASLDGGQKMMAVDLIQRMEQDSLGRNTIAVRRALGIVYEKQNERFMSNGHSLDVCWMNVMVEQGLSVVNFGF